MKHFSNSEFNVAACTVFTTLQNYHAFVNPHFRVHSANLVYVIVIACWTIWLDPPNAWRSLRYAGYIYQSVFPRIILEAIYAPDEVWGRDYCWHYTLFSGAQQASVVCCTVFVNPISLPQAMMTAQVGAISLYSYPYLLCIPVPHGLSSQEEQYLNCRRLTCSLTAPSHPLCGPAQHKGAAAPAEGTPQSCLICPVH